MNTATKALSVFELAFQILSRKQCSERDIVYHVIGPLLEVFGWSRTEMYFELDFGRSTPDIALRTEQQKDVVLTVEAKGRNLLRNFLSQGSVIEIENTEDPRRNDPLLQVFNQLHRIQHNWAVLTDGEWFGLFTIPEKHQRSLACLSTVMVRKNTCTKAKMLELERMLSRKSYSENTSSQHIELIKQLNRQPEGYKKRKTSDSERRAIALPENWKENMHKWIEMLPWIRGQLTTLYNKVTQNNINPDERLAAYEIVRFCHIFSARFPKGFQLRFKQGANTNLHVHPNWSPGVLRTQDPFLLQLTVGGERTGIIWVNCSNDSGQEDSPFNQVNRIKGKIKSLLPKSPKIYESGIVEILVAAIETAASEMKSLKLI